MRHASTGIFGKVFICWEKAKNFLLGANRINDNRLLRQQFVGRDGLPYWACYGNVTTTHLLMSDTIYSLTQIYLETTAVKTLQI
jgi:hypothetical protein